MQTSALERVKETAEKFTPKSLKKLSERIAVVEGKLKQGTAILENIFGFENDSKKQISEEVVRLKLEEMNLSKTVDLGSKYPKLSLEPLRWRDTNGWPRLAVFNLQSPLFEISVSGKYDGWDNRYRYSNRLNPKLPGAIASCYDDVFKALRARANKKRKTIKLSCKFQGLIPTDVREKIVQAREAFGENIFIVAEPKGFEVNEIAIVIPKKDPLVVGFDGVSLWLIADFETTPVEEAMIFEVPNISQNK